MSNKLLPQRATRPEDRTGLTPGTKLSHLNADLYRRFALHWRRLPNFKGKVRFARLLRSVLLLGNHHFLETLTLSAPAPYEATLDLHSWHEFLAFFNGAYEDDTTRFLARCYDGNGCFIDVGANIGLISLPFAAMIDPSRSAVAPFVVCIEAVQSNYIRLRHNIELNGRDNTIIAVGQGVGEREKTVDIQVEGNLRQGEGTGTANILADNTTHSCEKIPLTITTIDTLCAGGVIPDKCSLMKIDVDGYDFFVLQGANKLLASSRPVILGEFSSHCLAWHGHSREDVRRYAADLQYAVFSRSKDDWRFVALEQAETDQDLLLVPKEKLEELNWCLER